MNRMRQKFAMYRAWKLRTDQGRPTTLLMLQTLSSSVIANSVTNGQLSLHGMRILVVDDDRNTLEIDRKSVV